jgi:hypothetical protein
VKAYDDALRLRRELGQHSLSMDDLAGLARVAVAQGQRGRALELVNEIVTWLEANGSGGIDDPLQAYLTCYRILRSTADGDAPAPSSPRRTPTCWSKPTASAIPPSGARSSKGWRPTGKSSQSGKRKKFALDSARSIVILSRAR